MEQCEKHLILASASPRRRELLERYCSSFTVMAAEAEEKTPEGLTPEEYVKSLAAAKAAEVFSRAGDEDAVVIAADTVVESDGVILGKPGSTEQAMEMLSALSGKAHRVWTGVTVRSSDREKTEAECTTVRFRPVSRQEIRDYAATSEPLDKAGAYGYQGLAGIFVESIEGDYYNVVGLPLCRLSMMLREFDISLL